MDITTHGGLAADAGDPMTTGGRRRATRSTQKGGVTLASYSLYGKHLGWRASAEPAPAALAETQLLAVQMLIAELRDMADRLERDLLTGETV